MCMYELAYMYIQMYALAYMYIQARSGAKAIMAIISYILNFAGVEPAASYFA